MNLSQLFPTATAEDLALYFKHTLIYAKHPDVKHFDLLYVNEMIGNVIALTDMATPLRSVHIPEVDVEIQFPEAGYANWRSTVVLLHRLSKRQNQKGICDKTVALDLCFTHLFQRCLQEKPYFKLLDKYSLADSGMMATNQRTTVLRAVLTQAHQMTPLSVAWAKLAPSSTPVVARAVSRKFALSKGMVNENPTLWFDGTMVATMPSPRRISIDNENGMIFAQEIVDCFGPQGVEVTTM